MLVYVGALAVFFKGFFYPHCRIGIFAALIEYPAVGILIRRVGAVYVQRFFAHILRLVKVFIPYREVISIVIEGKGIFVVKGNSFVKPFVRFGKLVQPVGSFGQVGIKFFFQFIIPLVYIQARL